MDHVEIKINDGVATLAMNHPESRNALGPSLTTDLKQALMDVHQEKRVHSVVLIGKGQAFSSGVDLKAFAELTDLEFLDSQLAWIQAWQSLTELCETILRLPKPVIAAVNGPAVGAGLAIALAADLMVMSESATLRANASQRGLVGGLTGPLLAFRCGSATAARMLLTAEPIESAEADRRGLCCQVVSDDQIWVAASDWARRCNVGPRESAQATKRMINESIGEALLTQLTNGAASAATVCNTESAVEGIRAFVEKRTPEWP